MDSRQAKQAIMQAEARVSEWRRNFVANWYKSEAVAQVKAIWMQLPDELKEKFAATHPQEYADLMKEIKKKEK